MVNYRRNKIAGGVYFFTVTLRDRRSKLLVEQIKLLKASMQQVNKENPYKTVAIVVLPDHIHTIWELPIGDTDYSLRWRKIKSYFTRGMAKNGLKLQRNKHGASDIWQRRFWEHTIKDEKDLASHVDYIHYNPIKHALVKKIVDWRYSSFHRYVWQGIIDENWSGDGMGTKERGFGER